MTSRRIGISLSLVAVLVAMLLFAANASGAKMGGGNPPPSTATSCVLQNGRILSGPPTTRHDICQITLVKGDLFVSGNVSVLGDSPQADHVYAFIWQTSGPPVVIPQGGGGSPAPTGIASAWCTVPSGRTYCPLSVSAYVRVTEPTTFVLSVMTFTNDPTTLVIGIGGSGLTPATRLDGFRIK